MTLKTLINLFANNNFKKFVVENDTRKIKKYYKNKGFVDAQVNYRIEFLISNKVNIYFNIVEGNLYLLNDISYLDNENLLDNKLKNTIKL